MILCHLASGEKSVMELKRLSFARQAAVSQHLSCLRLERFVGPPPKWQEHLLQHCG